MEFLLQTTFRALRHRNFRLFFYGQLISLIGTWMQQTALSWLIYQLTASAFLLGLITALSSAPMILSSLWGGALADQYPKRSILLITQTFSMILAFLLTALVAFQSATIWWLIIIGTLSGAVMGFDIPARQSFIAEMTGGQDLLNAVSLNSTIFNGARMIGPMLAGIVMAHAGIEACFLLNGLSFLAVIAGLCLMKLPRHIPLLFKGSLRQHITEGFTYVWRHSSLLTTCILFAVVGIFGWSYAIIMPVVVKDVFHAGEKAFGMMMSASGIGACLGALTVATIGHTIPTRRLTAGGIWLFSITLLLFSFSRNFYFSLACLVIEGFAMMLFFSSTNTIIQTMTPNNMRGRVMGIWALIFGAITPLGSLEVGTLASWIGAPMAIGIGAIVCAAAVLIAGPRLRQLQPHTSKIPIPLP